MDAALLWMRESMRPEDKQYDLQLTGNGPRSSGRSIVSKKKRTASATTRPSALSRSAAPLGYMDLRFGDDDWRKGRPALADWFDRFSERPSMIETVPKDIH